MSLTQNTTGDASMLGNADSDLKAMNAEIAAHLPVARGGLCDHWWLDAGWYQVPPTATDWTAVGTWEPDPTRYPHGLRPIMDRARANGMKSIVWHEPERVTNGSWLHTHHPEWLLGAGANGNWLLNFGHPAAWNWAVLPLRPIDPPARDRRLPPGF